MSVVYVRNKLKDGEMRELQEEFPQYEFLNQADLESSPLEFLRTRYWDYVEILYDDTLSLEECDKALRLRWVHSPTPHCDKIACYQQESKRKENLLVTRTNEINSTQISEYVMAGVYSFAKKFFVKKAPGDEEGIKEEYWKVGGRLALIVGLGDVGTALAQKFQGNGMKVWGVTHQRSFHSFCHKTFSFRDLHSLLPVADVVCLCLPRCQQYSQWFRSQQVELLKEGSVFVMINPVDIVEETAFVYALEKKKLRGVIIDTALPFMKPYLNRDNVLIAGGDADKPLSKENCSFTLFRYNLRQYIHGNIVDMKNLASNVLEY
jgi:D-2-hydroxyacid dehydrogenase (NADP+)